MSAEHSIKRVALAGATGNLGGPMLQVLLDEHYEVTVFTRLDSKHSFPGGVKVVKTDYKDPSALVEALKGQDALISNLATAAVDAQKPLMEAAIAANVKRVIPSEFGCDLDNPKARALPVYGAKVAVQQLVKEKTKGTSTTYTLIYNNAFLDKLVFSSPSIDIKGKKLEFVDGGEATITVTPVLQVAQGTVAVLRHLEETANRSVRLHGMGLTQKKLLAVAQDVVGKDGWTIIETTSAEEESKSYKAFKENPNDVLGWVMGFLTSAIFGAGYDNDFTYKNDNALLGLKGATQEDLERVIKESS